MFEDIFDGLDDITKKPAAPEKEDGWDSGQPGQQQVWGENQAWDSGAKENIWRTGNQFWDTGSPRPGFGPASNSVPDPSADPDYDPELDEEFIDEDDDDERW
jgi:hypothetical protein